jgi:small-conductance mechanosensitive channel
MTSGQDVVMRGENHREADSHLIAWGTVGIVAQIAFMAGWLIAETWQGPRYSVIADTISDMQAATAPHVWFIVTCFAIGSLGTFCFAIFGLRPALAAGRAVPHAVWMLALAGLAIGNSFPLIPCELPAPGCTAHHQLYSPGGITDVIVATAAFLVLVFTPAQLRKRLAELPEWRRLVPMMTIARVACPLGWMILSVASLTGTAQGLAERALATSCVVWIASLAITLIQVARRSVPVCDSVNGMRSARPGVPH